MSQPKIVSPLIKIDGRVPLAEARKAPICRICGSGTPEYQGMCMRKKDGKVFSVWKCFSCGEPNYWYEPARKVGEYDNPRAIKVSEEQYPQIGHAVALPRPW